MIKISLKRLVSDYLAFVKNHGTSKVVIIIIYIDNFFFFGPNFTKINLVKSFLSNQYKMKDLGPCGQFTRIKLEQNLEKRTISLSQKIYLEKALDYANMIKSKPVYFLIVFAVNFWKNLKELVDKKLIHLY